MKKFLAQLGRQVGADKDWLCFFSFWFEANFNQLLTLVFLTNLSLIKLNSIIITLRGLNLEI